MPPTPIIDFEIIEKNAGHIQVLAVAAPKQHVVDRLNELYNAGANPQELAVGAAIFQTLSPFLPETLQTQTILFIEIGATNTDFCIVKDSRCLFARTLSGGLDMVESGRRTLLGDALQRTLASYRVQNDKSPSLILLAGESVFLEGSQAWLAAQLKFDCHVIPLPPVTGVDVETLPIFTRSTALAGRAIARGKQLNLMRGNLSSKTTIDQLRSHMQLIAVCFITIVITLSTSLFMRYHIANVKNEKFTANLTTVTSELLEHKTSSPTRARQLLRQDSQIDDPLPRFDAYDTLEAISESIPTDIAHDTRQLAITIDDQGNEGQFELQGTVSSITERDRIIGELEKHHCFKNIKSGSTSTTSNNRKNYKIAVTIDCSDKLNPAGNKGNNDVQRRN